MRDHFVRNLHSKRFTEEEILEKSKTALLGDCLINEQDELYVYDGSKFVRYLDAINEKICIEIK